MLLSGLLALTLAATPPTGSSVSPPTVPAQDDAPLRIARTGPAAELDLARHLVRASRTEEALAHLDLLLAGVEDPASDPGLAALSRERGRVAGLLDLRDSHLAKLAAEKGRLRIPVDGKHRNLKVAGYDEGVISFAQNKYDIEFLTVDELALEDLARAFKNGKVMPLELRSYALALAGDRTWNKVWGPDLDPPAQHLADLDDAEASADRGAKVEALRELEDFLGQDPGRKEGERIVALVEAVWPEGQVALDEDDGRHRFRALRDLVTAGLEASFGPAALPSILHAQAAEMRGEELWLRYDFDDEEQLLDWQRDESHLPEVRMIGLLQTPDEEHRIGIVDGALEGIQPALVLCIPLLFTLLGGGALGALYRRVGDGLHAHRPWARYAALVLSVLVLGDLPFGLPLGLLGLGVLLDGEAAAAFEPTASTPVARETRAARRVQAARARQVA